MPSSAPTTRNWSADVGMGSEAATPPGPNLRVSSRPRPTSSHRVYPSDSSMDLQGTAIEDLGEAGTHLGRKQVAGEGPVGTSGQQGLGTPSEHLRAL